MSGGPVTAGHFITLPGRVAGGEAVRLHHAQAGSPANPLVLLLHGFPEYWQAWEPAMPALAGRHFVVAPDQRGYNRSSKPAAVSDYRPSELIADLVALMDVLGQHEAVVVGHDWGGAVAWGLALRFPRRVRRLVILNAPHPVAFARALAADPAQQAASAYMNWLRAPGSETLLAENDFRRLDKMLAGFGGAGGPARWYDDATRARYHEAWSRPGAIAAMVNWYRATPMHPPTDGEPGAAGLSLAPADHRLAMPTRVLWGLDDPALLPVLIDGLEAFGDDLRVTRYPGSHWLLHEDPTGITAAIVAALDD